MSYVQILDHLDHQEQQEDLYKFRAITGHQGPHSPQDENYKGSKYNVMVEWETGEITVELLSLIAADDPVTCAEYMPRNMTASTWMAGKDSIKLPRTRNSQLEPLTNLR